MDKNELFDMYESLGNICNELSQLSIRVEQQMSAPITGIVVSLNAANDAAYAARQDIFKRFTEAD